MTDYWANQRRGKVDRRHAAMLEELAEQERVNGLSLRERLEEACTIGEIKDVVRLVIERAGLE